MSRPQETNIQAVLDGLAAWDYAHTKQLIGFALGLLVVFCLVGSIYRIWFHPLSKFNGPPLLSAIHLPFLYRNFVKGLWVRDVPPLHRKYGPVVRIGPNHLALDGSVGWPTVFGHRSGGKKEYSKPKGHFFKGDHESIIGAGRDDHRRMRRQLAHAFSDSALSEQESTLNKYVAMLMDRLEEHSKGGQPIDIVQWLNFTTFDIIGELAFNDSFHSLENNGYHPWVLSIFRGIRGGALDRFFRSYPLLNMLVGMLNIDIINNRDATRTHARDKAKARMSDGVDSKSGNRDFMNYMMRNTRSGEPGMSTNEVLATSPILVVAGSETTATALSGLWFYLGQNPSVYRHLADEVRSTFATEGDITIRSVAAMEYLQACLEETLRVYPPAAETPPRVSPGDFIDGHYVPAGTMISVYQWATFRNPDNFADPDSFSPQRWLPSTHPLYEEKFANDNKAAFKPFSFGSRDCIGKNLAYAEMRLIASRFMHRFDYELAPDQSEWHSAQRAYVVWEKGPLRLQLQSRVK